MRSFPFIFIPLDIPTPYFLHSQPYSLHPYPDSPHSTLIPRIPIILLISFPNFPFCLLQIANYKFLLCNNVVIVNVT